MTPSLGRVAAVLALLSPSLSLADRICAGTSHGGIPPMDRRPASYQGSLASEGQPARPLNCTCKGGVTCATNSPANWTNCGGAAPDSNDTISCSGANTVLQLAATGEWKNLAARDGCQVQCTNPGPAVFSFNSLISPALQFQEEVFVIDGYNGGQPFLNGPPSLSCSGRDVTFKWKGTGITGAVMILCAGDNQIQDGDENNCNITLRGIERAMTQVGTFSEGATAGDADFVDCIKYPSGFTPASKPVVGDTIVFTSGRSKEYWYRVSGVGTTTECTASSCGGLPCDLEIDRAATTASPNMVAGSRSWSSLTKVASLGGPARVATPDDTDANGIADSSGTRPAAGDQFVVFLPVRIEGGEKPITGNGATDTGGGIRMVVGGANTNMRYIEVGKGGCQIDESCSENGFNGCAVLNTFSLTITSPEGDLGFWNLHDWASGQGVLEIARTHKNGDTRPNHPYTFRHWYLHDTDREIDTIPCTRIGMGSGMEIVVDAPDDYVDGLTMDGLHCARQHSGYCFVSHDSGTTIPHKNVLLRNVIIHDSPQILTYSVNDSTSGMVGVKAGVNTVEGLSAWDLGGASNPYRVLGGQGKDNDGSRVVFSLTNGFVVNIDTNTAGTAFDLPAAGMCQIDLTASTDGITISDSYFKSIVGSVGQGGNWNFNFIKDTQIEDSGGGCLATSRHAAIINPVSMTGNVITRSSPLSCTQIGVYLPGYESGSDCTDRTRRIVSNVFDNIGWTRTDDTCAGVVMDSDLMNVTRDVDVYNNVINFGGNTCGSDNNLAVAALGDRVSNITNVYYNIMGGDDNHDNAWGILFQSGTQFEDYNRCFDLSGVCIAAGSNAHDVDSDVQNMFTDHADFRLAPRCDSPERTRNPWGGPVGPLAYGIRELGFFHPAVLPLMDADAFKRYDWRQCGGSFQERRRFKP